MRPTQLLAVGTASLLLLAGCGTAGSGGNVRTEPTSGDSVSRGTTTELTVSVRERPDGEERVYTLTCDPAGGDHPDPEAACGALEGMDDPFAPVPRDAMCTEVYGGPQTATVTGTFQGRPVEARFSRTDGCEIARWDKHVALLVVRGGVEDM